jgi:GntR family transcriptional regulator
MLTKRGTVAATVAERITSGELVPGQELPRDADMEAEFSASRSTVRAAMDDLTRAGMVVSVRGRPRKVAPRRVPALVHLDRPQGRTVGAQEPSLWADSWAWDVIEDGHDIDERLKVRVDDTWVVRELLRLMDGRPHNLATWWYPSRVALGTLLAGEEDIPGGAIPYLARMVDLAVVHGGIEVRPPARAEAERLAIPASYPARVALIVATREGRDKDGALMFREVTLWPADRARLRWSYVAPR